MIRHLIAAMYGGKIDDEADHAVLDAFVARVFCPEAYDVGHLLVGARDARVVEVDDDDDDDESDDDNESEDGGAGAKLGRDQLAVPSGTTIDDFAAWVHALPEREPPTWLGLPADAEKMLLVGRGREMVEKLGRVLELLREGEAV